MASTFKLKLYMDTHIYAYIYLYSKVLFSSYCSFACSHYPQYHVSTRNFLALGNYFSFYFSVVLPFYFYSFPEINHNEITKLGNWREAWAVGLQCLMESHTLAKVHYFCRLRTPQTSTAPPKLFRRNMRLNIYCIRR